MQQLKKMNFIHGGTTMNNIKRIVDRIKAATAFEIESVECDCTDYSKSATDNQATLDFSAGKKEGRFWTFFMDVALADEKSLAAKLTAKAKGLEKKEGYKMRTLPQPAIDEEGNLTNGDGYIGKTVHSVLPFLFESIETNGISEVLDKELRPWLWSDPTIRHYSEIETPPSRSAFEMVEALAISKAFGGSLCPGANARLGISAQLKNCRGLYLHGPSYRGKTTAAYHLATVFMVIAHLKKIEEELYKHDDGYRADIIPPAIWNADAFGDTAKAKAKASSLTKWLDEELLEPPLLILDDLDKFQFSDSVGTALFGMLKRRIECDKFTVFTANQTASKISKRFCADTQAPFLNRVKSHFIPINFAID